MRTPTLASLQRSRMLPACLARVACRVRGALACGVILNVAAILSILLPEICWARGDLPGLLRKVIAFVARILILLGGWREAYLAAALLHLSNMLPLPSAKLR